MSFARAIIVTAVLSFSPFATAEDAPKEIKLWSEGEGGEGANGVSLFYHEPAGDDSSRPAIVVCPGGGYGGVVMSYEGHDIAKWFAEHGCAAFVLKYRVAPHKHPAPMDDVQRAIRYIRAHSEVHGIDTKRIGVIGFSAGGHLAATAGTHFEPGDPAAKDPLDKVSSRPDFMILAYPVISMIDGVAHVGSKRNLLGDAPDAALVEKMSLEKQVTKQTPPTFILQTNEDKVVPAEHAVLFYGALRKAGVPVEFHVFQRGPHGVGLGRNEGSKSWPSLLEDWLIHLKVFKG